MYLILKKTIENILKKQGIRPLKRLGQNFLINKSVLDKIIAAADLSQEDTVLEIGPGVGTLTQELAKRVKKVIAVEKDKRMVELLKENLKDFENIEIVRQDALKFDPETYCLKPKAYKLVANLPYYIVSPVIRKFLEIESPPGLMVLMVQKEVAQRICALPPHQSSRTYGVGARPPKMNLLAVSVQFYAEPKIISFISKNSFWPTPKVDSAILRIAPLIDAGKKQIDTDLFFKIVKAGFSHPRKQLVNNFSSVLKLNKPSQILPARFAFGNSKAGGQNKTWADKEGIKSWLLKNKISPSQRAETLTLENWLSLTNNF